MSFDPQFTVRPVRYPPLRHRSSTSFFAGSLGLTAVAYALIVPVVYGLGWLDAKVDSSLNSWLPRNGHFQWSMIFSKHFETLLWLNDRHAWLLVNLAGGIFWGTIAAVYIWVFRD